MITFEEAQRMHEALSFDSMLTPKARLTAPIEGLAFALDEGVEALGKVEVIVLPWQYAMPFQRQWENIPAIKSVRGPSTEPWLWGHFITYRGIDCLATSLMSVVLLSSVRELKGMYEPDRVVLIDVGLA